LTAVDVVFYAQFLVVSWQNEPANETVKWAVTSAWWHFH